MDEKTRNCLPLTGHSLPDCDVDAPIRDLPRKDYSYARDAFKKAAKQAEEAGKEDESRVYESLAVTCSFHPTFDNKSEPYGPMMQWGDKRTAIPDDLTDEDLDTIASLKTKTSSPLIRARLCDLLWLRRRDHISAQQACADYVETAVACLTKEEWVDSAELFYRGLQLGHFLGRNSEAWKNAERETVQALQSPLAQSEPYYAAKLFRILFEMGAGDSTELAKIAHEHALKAEQETDPRRTRTYYDHEADFWAVAKVKESEAAARLASAMTYELEAEKCLSRSAPSLLAASHFLTQGIEALRRAHADPAVVSRLRKKLREYQGDSLKEMKPLMLDPDIANKVREASEKAAEKVAKYIEHPDLEEALKRLAFAPQLASPAKLRDEVLKLAKDHPLSNIFDATLLDNAGRVKERIGGLLV